MPKLIYISLLLGLLFVGCGYKAEPVYVDSNKENSK
jgi:hypothetical protein